MNQRPFRTERDTTMLHASIGIQQLGANRADFRPDRMCHHLGKPSRAYHIRVVVEQDNDFAPRLLHSGVVHSSEVKRTSKRDYAYPRITSELRKQVTSRPLVAVIINDKKLQRVILRPGKH